MRNKRWSRAIRIRLIDSGTGSALYSSVRVVEHIASGRLFVNDGILQPIEQYLAKPRATGLRLIAGKFGVRYIGTLHGYGVICFDHLFAHLIHPTYGIDATHRFMSEVDIRPYWNFVKERIQERRK